MTRWLLLALFIAPAALAQDPAAAQTEENCSDRIDNDGDTVTDCADADCYDKEECQRRAAGRRTSNELCSDFVDNDGDGFTDCDDKDCQSLAVTVCSGSWKGSTDGGGSNTNNNVSTDPSDDIPELTEGMSVEDLIGKGSDNDGERNDVLCSDGLDNDLDGKTDCADIGCRFDPNVTVCRGTPGLRFSIVANVTSGFSAAGDDPANIVDDFVNVGQLETRFTVLQLRAFGPLPGIQDSFFLVSIRAENAPRLTFAMANFPIGGGHFININSGGGGLSNALILSAAKRALVDAPFYVYSAFEQGNGAAAELNGPVIPGLLDYRAFVAGGSGFFNGNVGGRFFTFDNENFTWTVGGQLIFSPIGYFNRWDSAYLYTEVPTTLGITVGAKYDQRAQEIYPALNVAGVLRSGRFLLSAESYAKYELAFGSAQASYNVMGGFLVWPKHVYLAADFGQYVASELEKPPEIFQTDLRRQRNELMWRFAAHWYVWRNVGVLSLVLRDRYLGARVADPNAPLEYEREIKAVAQFRF